MRPIGRRWSTFPSLSVRQQFALPDHGYGASASRGVHVHVSAFAGTHCANPRRDGQAELTRDRTYSHKIFNHGVYLCVCRCHVTTRCRGAFLRATTLEQARHHRTSAAVCQWLAACRQCGHLSLSTRKRQSLVSRHSADSQPDDMTYSPPHKHIKHTTPRL